ncbi:hypothetical protein FQR65_LT07020 [Abscondita terminalis]|nr:hypothetical protein FQR65_LT07020 [Abscondita terminalis]
MTSEFKTPADAKKNNSSSTPQAKSKRLEERNKKSENVLQSKSDENKDEKPKNVVPLRNRSQTRSEEREESNKDHVLPVQNDVKKKRNRRRKERSTSTQGSNKAESCMTDIIIEKTRMLKNQELQIEALSQQVTSLKEVCKITKDMLDIRNIEVKQLNDKLSFMEDKFKSEKDRHEMVHSKLERMMMLNDELKNEYRKQLSAFSELKKVYHDHLGKCKSHSDSTVIKNAGEDENKLEIGHTNTEIENINEKLLCVSEVSTTEIKQEDEGKNKQEMVHSKTESADATQSKGDGMLENDLKTKYEFVTTSSNKQNKESSRNVQKAKKAKQKKESN